MGYRLGSKVIRGVARNLFRLRARQAATCSWSETPGACGGCPFFKDEVLIIAIAKEAGQMRAIMK